MISLLQGEPRECKMKLKLEYKVMSEFDAKGHRISEIIIKTVRVKRIFLHTEK
jgi:hypothetical protein